MRKGQNHQLSGWARLKNYCTSPKPTLPLVQAAGLSQTQLDGDEGYLFLMSNIIEV